MTTQNIEAPRLDYEISRRGERALQIVASDPIDAGATSVIEVRSGASVGGGFQSFGWGPVFTMEVVNPTAMAVA